MCPGRGDRDGQPDHGTSQHPGRGVDGGFQRGRIRRGRRGRRQKEESEQERAKHVEHVLRSRERACRAGAETKNERFLRLRNDESIVESFRETI